MLYGETGAKRGIFFAKNTSNGRNILILAEKIMQSRLFYSDYSFCLSNEMVHSSHL